MTIRKLARAHELHCNRECAQNREKEAKLDFHHQLALGHNRATAKSKISSKNDNSKTGEKTIIADNGAPREESETEALSRLREEKQRQKLIENSEELIQLRRQIEEVRTNWIRREQQIGIHQNERDEEIIESKEKINEDRQRCKDEINSVLGRIQQVSSQRKFRDDIREQIEAKKKVKEFETSEKERERFELQCRMLMEQNERQAISLLEMKRQQVFANDLKEQARHNFEIKNLDKALEKEEDNKRNKKRELQQKQNSEMENSEAKSCIYDDLSQNVNAILAQAEMEEEEATLDRIKLELSTRKLSLEEQARLLRSKKESKELLDYAKEALHLKTKKEMEEEAEKANIRKQMLEEQIRYQKEEKTRVEKKREEMKKFLHDASEAIEMKYTMQQKLQNTEAKAEEVYKLYQAEKDRVISQERKRLLKEAAAILSNGPVPKGLLKNEEELKVIQKEGGKRD